jgi:hypothetical protein
VRNPEGWEREARLGPWPFVTAETFRGPDGRRIDWDSRAHRKHQRDASIESTWWAPSATGWWIGVLFAIGSACFLAGSFPPYYDLVGEAAADTTFFVGSIFFTSAAFLQFREAARAPDRVGDDVPAGPAPWKAASWWNPARIDVWATSVQLAGTIAFNVSTFMATREGFDATQQDHRIWAPDAIGSIFFLVASALAFAEVGHAWVSWRPRSIAWWIGACNLAGSVAFGASAIGAYVVVDTGDLLSEVLANGGTFLGALGFLVGALLLLPERTLPKEVAATAASTAAPEPA